MTLRLWGNGASRALLVHWALHELHLPYERRLVGSRTGETQTPEFLKLNSAGKIPVLEDDELILTESAAIVTYLAETYGRESRLVPPVATRRRAKYNQWCFFAMTELDAQALYIVHKHTTLSAIYGQAPQAVEVAKQTFARQSAIVERHLSDGRGWVLGETFTCADILLAYCLHWGEQHALVLEAASQDYVRRATARDAYQAAVDAANN